MSDDEESFKKPNHSMAIGEGLDANEDELFEDEDGIKVPLVSD